MDKIWRCSNNLKSYEYIKADTIDDIPNNNKFSFFQVLDPKNDITDIKKFKNTINFTLDRQTYSTVIYKDTKNIGISKIGTFEGKKWYSYTINFDDKAIGTITNYLKSI